MSPTTKSSIIICATVLLTNPSDVFAVAFKVHNQTNFKFRMRVKDRGEFRDWVEMRPGFWNTVAEKVERNDHDIEIDIFVPKKGESQPEWVEYYRGRHGSKVFTRVLHLFEYVGTDQQRILVMTWNDEPPGCRDKPVFEGTAFKNGCLLRSGWTDDLLKGTAAQVGLTALRKLFGGA